MILKLNLRRLHSAPRKKLTFLAARPAKFAQVAVLKQGQLLKNAVNVRDKDRFDYSKVFLQYLVPAVDVQELDKLLLIHAVHAVEAA